MAEDPRKMIGKSKEDERKIVDDSKSASKTLRFDQVCKKLVEAIPLSDVPTYVLQNEKNFSDSFDLYRKVEANFSIWKSHLKLSNNFRLDCKGCCEIDNFTGNELLRVYHDIIGKKQAENSQKHLYKPGDFFYLSKNKKLCAGIMFTKTKLVVSTPESSGKETEERSYKFLYTKLYTVDPAKKYGDDVLYDPTVVEELRKSAQEQFPDFLNKKIKDFELCPYGYSFLSVLVPVAYRISWRGNPQNFPKEHSLDYDIPFAACLKFAFDKNRTGMISGLCGEGGYKEKEVLWEERAETIVENAKQLINSGIRSVQKDKWSKNEVNRAAEKVKKDFSIN